MTAFNETRKQSAIYLASALLPVLQEIGLGSLREIGDELNRRGIKTMTEGKQWHPQSVSRLLKRLGLSQNIDIAGAMPSMSNNSIDLILCSPPYANQRMRQYGGISESDYPAWTVEWMAPYKRSLKLTGSIAIVIRPHVKDGCLSDYVLRTRLAVRDAGWFEIDELIWTKPSTNPIGNTKKPRRSWESILWFSRSTKPYCDPLANGNMSKRVGFVTNGDRGRNTYIRQSKSSGELHTGIARCPDYVSVAAGGDRHPENQHPAQHPTQLYEWIIRLLCPKGGLVVDPFLGSGTAAVAAAKTGRRFLGHDINEDYVKFARGRVARMVGADV